MYRWNNGTGPVVPGDDYHTVGTKLTGKMEMQRVGLMGHSRGGEGVTDFIRFNRLRPVGAHLQPAGRDVAGADRLAEAGAVAAPTSA